MYCAAVTNLISGFKVKCSILSAVVYSLVNMNVYNRASSNCIGFIEICVDFLNC